MPFPCKLALSLLPLAVVLGLAACRTAPTDSGPATYVGSKSCDRCGHGKIYKQWSDSLHSHMIHEVNPKTILGNFSNQTLDRENWQFRMFRDNDDFFIWERSATGRETVYKVAYTLGSKRIQHYLCMLPDGSMQVAFPTWDVLAGKWIHDSDIVRGAHHTEDGLLQSVQVWNKHCWNCHTSQEDEGFDIKTGTFKTSFTESGINCEVCHGPGSQHVRKAESNAAGLWLARLFGKKVDTAIVNPAKLQSSDRMVDCIQCHARRMMIKRGFRPGENYYDYFMPKLIELTARSSTDPVIWDERHRRFANECLVLQESGCYLKGNATCFTCHNPHQVNVSADSRYPGGDELCLQCHKSYRQEKAAAEHTHHDLKKEGGRCIECHMMLITNRNIKLLQGVAVRDHGINVPIPENTVKHAIPNACNNACHQDKNIDWVVSWMDKWYPKRLREDRFADAIAFARARDPRAVTLLIGYLGDSSQPTRVRGSAASFLGEFKGEEVAAALIKTLDDSDPLVRAESARSLSEVRSETSMEPLMRKLTDQVRSVRLNTIFALIKMGVLQTDGVHAEAFNRAKQEYLDFLREFPTVYETRVDLGTFYALNRNYAQALGEYQNAVKLRPEGAVAHYYLGVTYAQLGDFQNALQSFRDTLDIDPNFRNTRQLLNQILGLAVRK